jgi:hypothetical protein
LEHLDEDMESVVNFTIKSNNKKRKYDSIYEMQTKGNQLRGIERVFVMK